MRRHSRVILALVAACGVCVAASHGEQAARSAEHAVGTDVRAQIERARDRVFPSLVNISVINVSYWGGKETKGGSTGSGTIISSDGYVVTNHHVIDDGRTFKVTLADKREVPATLVGDDPMTDLAVLRLDMKALGSAPLPVAEFGDSDTLEVGDYVMAMGAPYGLARSFTLGVVSNTERVFTSFSGDDIQDQEFDFDVSSDIFTRWIQHDALILPGNSGGPLVNLDGKIIGVNTRGGSGLGFANPASLVQRVVRDLIDHGSVTRSTVGANFKSVKRTGYDNGVLVNSVIEGGPAHRAGLRAGDVLISMNSEPISARFPEEIPLVLRRIADMPVGTTVSFTYLRDGVQGNASVTTERLLREKGKQAALRTFGLSLSEITQKMARNRNLESTDGALVIGVRGGGPAEVAEPGINMGDVIKSIGGTPVRTLEDAVEKYKSLAQMDPAPEFVAVEFDRKGKSNLTLIKPRPDKPDDPPRELPKAWLGVATQPVLRDLAREIGLGEQLGFRVTRVYPGTLAAQAGLRQGDIILELNGKALSPRGMQDAGMLQRQVRQLRIGESIALKLRRETQDLELTLATERTRLTPEEARRDTNRDFELTVRELTFFDRDDNRWSEETSGVVVASVERAGWAGLAGLVEGDLVQRVNRHEIKDLASYRAAMEALAKEQPERVSFFVLRGQRTQFKFAEPDWKPVVQAEPGDANAGGG